jgi:hypothetical protein
MTRKSDPDTYMIPNKVFLDSGAFTLFHQFVKKLTKAQEKAFYKSKEFKTYCSNYASLIKQYHDKITIYANIDQIYNPQGSWDNLKRLENDYGIKPTPVVHHGTPLKWVERYVTAGYKYIALGGTGLYSTYQTYPKWADQVFRLLCSTPTGMPAVKTHGFAITSTSLLTRYPWTSVDSSTHRKCAGYGQIRVPRRGIDGQYAFHDTPLVAFVSDESFRRGDKTKQHIAHFASRGVGEETIISDKTKVMEWLEYMGGMPYGSMDAKGEMVEWGVSSSYSARIIVGLQHTKHVKKSIRVPFPFNERARIAPSLHHLDEELEFPNRWLVKKPHPLTVYTVESKASMLQVPPEYRHLVPPMDSLYSFALFGAGLTKAVREDPWPEWDDWARVRLSSEVQQQTRKKGIRNDIAKQRSREDQAVRDAGKFDLGLKHKRPHRAK